MSKPITARLSPRHWRTLRALSAKRGESVSVVFDQILRQAARAAEIADEELEDAPESADADDDGRADAVQEHTAAAMSAIANGALETGDPDAALADAAASVEANDSDEELPPGKRGRRRSPLSLWASTSREGEGPNDGHPARRSR